MTPALILYNPPCSKDAHIVLEGAKYGLGILDMEYLDMGAIRTLIDRIDRSGVDFGIRVDPTTEKAMILMAGERPKGLKALVCVSKGSIGEMIRRGIYDAARSLGLTIYQEVCDVVEASEASSCGADHIIARGSEAGGRSGSMPAAKLVSEIRREIPASKVFALGDASDGPMGSGAEGIVLDSQIAGLPGGDGTIKGRFGPDGGTATIMEDIGKTMRISLSPTGKRIKQLDSDLKASNTPGKERYKAVRSEIEKALTSGEDPYLLTGEGGRHHIGSLDEVGSLFGKAATDERPVVHDEHAAQVTVDGAPVPSDYYDRAIAIVGMGSVFPKGIGNENFWNMIMNGVDACMEVPPNRWDWRLHYDPDPTVPYKTYSKVGTFITDLEMDYKEFKIPPKAFSQFDLFQRYAIRATKEALIDSKLIDRKDLDRSRIGCVIANAGGGERRDGAAIRTGMEEIEVWARSTPAWADLPESKREAFMKQLRAEVDKNIFNIDEDTMPGALANISSGRVANIFDFNGPNFITDAACASTHAAIYTTVDQLLMRRIDIGVAGGTDSGHNAHVYIEFSKIGALTPDGSRPFSDNANGFLMGEGAGTLILKRIEDAVRDGDRIYALIRGIAGSSDGKGKGITAPNPKGQSLAVMNAMKDARVDRSTISFVEGHGTSTQVGDIAELTSLMSAFGGLPRNSLGITSVKSQIGHLKAAAGAAGMIKAVLAIQKHVLPPQINFDKPNHYFDWERSPFYVITKPMEWARIRPDVPRRCGVSSFGFGGTNFHIILEEFDPEIYESWKKVKQEAACVDTPAQSSAAPAPASSVRKVVYEYDKARLDVFLKEKGGLASEVFLFSSDNPLDLLAMAKKKAEEAKGASLLRDVWERPSFKGRYRLAISALNPVHFAEQVETLQKVGMNEKGLIALAAKGIFVGDLDRVKTRKTALMFPGQGSQYINMFRDLSEKYLIVERTFTEADAVMKDYIENPLTSYIFKDVLVDTPEYKTAQDTLTRTEFNQPAMLTADTSMYKMLLALGVKPDIVMGHSLGEYAALIASGALSFEDALVAVSARGREMRDLNVPDPGKMASIGAGADEVEKVLKEIDGYVIAANKNCYMQTTIAGESGPMDKAMKRFSELGIESQYIPVSHAFHSGVVAPVRPILRGYLEKLDFRAPDIPLIANVDGDYYPSSGDPASVKKRILDILEEQVAAPVEWIKQVQRAHKDGCNVFIEVGPKRALSTFAYNILEENVKKGLVFPVTSNHPKKGGVPSFNEMVGMLWSIGYDLHLPELDDDKFFNPTFLKELSSMRKEIVLDQVPAQVPIIAPAIDQARPQPAQAAPVLPSSPSPSAAKGSAYAAVDAVGFDRYMHDNKAEIERFLRELYDRMPKSVPTPAQSIQSARRDVDLSGAGMTLPSRKGAHVVISGVAMGLPGQFKKVFSEDNMALLLQGRNLIEAIDKDYRQKFIEKNIIRLDKRPDGSADMIQLDDETKIAKLAGMLGEFDLVKEFGVPESLTEDLDIASQLAFAAGFLALRDAGIPMVKRYSQTSTGSYLPEGWELPIELQEDTGIVFASAFPGYDYLFKYLKEYNARGSDYAFPRHMMFAILAMGHSQFAQYIKAKGPNTQVNSACASSTLALGIAQDWIQSGRCKRVLIISADNPTQPDCMEWFGSQLLALGALTTEEDVTKAAVPFDRRRAGMILGSGAVGIVVEAEEEPRRRGMDPIVELLGTHLGNSAYHGSRLDIPHIARSMDRFITRMEREFGLDRSEIAPDLIFMSHETYTPARGGSSAAEVEALRRTFGDRFKDILIMNTKGYTGHAFGCCIEDPALIRSLEIGKAIPLANLDPANIDPQFEGLNLSRGGSHERKYGLRLGAGFGSQLAFALFRRIGTGGRQSAPQTYKAWLSSIATTQPVETEVVDNVLRLKDSGISSLIQHRAVKRDSSEIGFVKELSGVPEKEFEFYKQEVLSIFSAKTGIPLDMIDIDADLDTDLGIDSVKQVELFAAARIHFDLPKDEGVNIRDYETLRKVILYVASKKASSRKDVGARLAAKPTVEVRTSARSGTDIIADRILAIVSQKTGYPTEMLDLDLDLESDLGIDTVKQVELFASARGEFDLPRDDSVNLKDFPTLRHIIDYVHSKMGGMAPSVRTASVPGTVAVQAAPSADDGWEEARKRILSIVAQKTGYPPDMLELDLNLESDLGIDTVKQVELFASARGEFDLPRDDSVNLKDFPTLRHIIDYVNSKRGGSKKPTPSAAASSGPKSPAAQVAVHTAPAADPSPSALARGPKMAAPGSRPAPAAGSDWDVVKDRIVAIVVQKTGYPPDMLELDADLESDLGIDTVKQVELFASARGEFDLPRDDSVNLKDFSTLRRIIDYVARKALDKAPASVSAPAKVVLSVEDLKERINRWALFADPVPGIKGSRPKPLQGKRLILFGSASADIIREVLGCEVIPVHPEDILAERIVLTGYDGVLALHMLDSNFDPLNDDWKVESDKAVLSLFKAAKAFDPVLKKGGIFVSVTTMGGRFATDTSTNPLNGSVSGFTKSVKREYPSATVIAFDVRRDLPLRTVLERLSDELGAPEVALEAGWDGRRFLPALRIVEPAYPAVNTLMDGMRILISGGGGGITSVIAKSLAQRAKLEIHLLDKTEMPSNVKELASMDANRLAELKERIKDRLKDEKKQVTPVMLEREFSKVERSIAIHRLLEDIRKAGSKAHYHSLDVMDEKAVSNVVKKNGPFDGVLHAAGVEQSKLLVNKTESDFSLVFDVKVIGAKNIILATRNDPLRFFVSFSSVAGRFGNGGQVDYASANDTLDKIWGTIKKLHPDCLAKAVGWSAWADVGMASRGAVKTILELGGVKFIPVKEGVEFAITEMCSGREKEIFYAGSMGPLDREGIMKWTEGIHTPYPAQIAPLLDAVTGTGNNKSFLRLLDGRREIFLNDHRIMNVPVLPGSMGLEIFAEAGKRMIGSDVSLRDVRFVKVVGVDPVLDIRVEAVGEGDGVKMEIVSEKDGKRISHFSATAVKASPSEPVIIKGHPLQPRTVTSRVCAKDIYPHLFLENLYHVLDGAEVLGDGEFLGVFKPVKADLIDPGTGFSNKDLEFSPMHTELGFQLAGAYVLDRYHIVALPVSVGSVAVRERMATDERALAHVRFKGMHGKHYAFDIDLIDLSGRVRISIRDYTMAGLMPNEKDVLADSDFPFESVESPDPMIAITAVDTEALRKDMEYYKGCFGPEWKDTLSPGMTEKRMREHLAGRLAAKAAVAYHISVKEGRFVPVRSIAIMSEEGGRPYALVGGKRYEISITHSRRWAMCSLYESAHGCDLESTEPRERSFMDEAFADPEIKLLRRTVKEYPLTEEVAVTLFFSAKEAVLKMKGIGLSDNLRSVVVKKVEKVDDHLSMVIMLEHEKKKYKVMTRMFGAYVISTCRGN
jgi:acyl transferase domain-containing protein/acyl carrier protein/phosphopantetheinyl transferase/NAD(P)-dependent dehydrogenase (short-subunit alcohol dehydrogenase family)